MNRLKKHVIGMLAAATVAAVQLAVPPPASAMWSCPTRNTIARLQTLTAEMWLWAGNGGAAQYWYDLSAATWNSSCER